MKQTSIMISVTLMVTDLARSSSWVYALKGSRILAGRSRVLVNKSFTRGHGNESLLDRGRLALSRDLARAGKLPLLAAEGLGVVYLWSQVLKDMMLNCKYSTCRF